MKRPLLILFTLFTLFALSFSVSADETDKIKQPRTRDRTFEIGIADIDIGLSNNALTPKDFFREKVVLDLDKSNGLNFLFNAFITPFFFNYYRESRGKVIDWQGIGISTTFEAYGHANLSETLLSLGEARNDKSAIGAAAFAGIDIPVFFKYREFTIKIQPSLFYPVVYVVPDISYTNYGNDNDVELSFDYFMRIYTIGSFENGFSGITALPGIDLRLRVEYPLAEILGLNDLYSILDFDVGLDIINIPVIPSTIKDYAEMSGFVKMNKLDPGDLGNFIEYDNTEIIYGTGKKRVLRPFKMLAWADWRPLENVLLSIIPTLGFAINPLYLKPASFEGGITANVDVANFIILSLGFNYTDRYWKNSFGAVLYFRNFELDVGLDLRARNFIQSWQGYGFGARFGLKFGW